MSLTRREYGHNQEEDLSAFGNNQTRDHTDAAGNILNG